MHLLSKTPAKILTVGWSSGLIAPATSRDGRPDDHRGTQLVIHAMPMRAKFSRLLEP